MSESEGVTVRYDDAAQHARALARMRRYGLGSPRDHLAVELARVVFLLVPLLLLIAEVISPREMIAVFAGYFFLRWFNGYLKPRILAATGPRAFKRRVASPLTIQLDQQGIRSESNYGNLTLGWTDVPQARVFRNGVIIRVYEEQSLAIDKDALPNGMTPAELGEKIKSWQGAAQ